MKAKTYIGLGIIAAILLIIRDWLIGYVDSILIGENNLLSIGYDGIQIWKPILETFFSLYPTATEKELAYYVKGNALQPISGEYVFAELLNPVDRSF